MHGKQRQPAEAEGEGQGWAAAEDIVLVGLEHMGGKTVADRQQVTMEMHRALGRAGGAGCKGNEADIIAGAVKRLELAGFRAISCFEHAAGPVEPADGLEHGRLGPGIGQFLARRSSHSAREISAFSAIATSSLARSRGMVPTAMPPALMTAI